MLLWRTALNFYWPLLVVVIETLCVLIFPWIEICLRNLVNFSFFFFFFSFCPFHWLFVYFCLFEQIVCLLFILYLCVHSRVKWLYFDSVINYRHWSSGIHLFEVYEIETCFNGDDRRRRRHNNDAAIGKWKYKIPMRSKRCELAATWFRFGFWVLVREAPALQKILKSKVSCIVILHTIKKLFLIMLPVFEGCTFVERID